MEVRCDKCQARYRVEDARVGPQGLAMRCGKCQNVFRVTRPANAVEKSARELPAPAPAGGEAGGTLTFEAPPRRASPPAPGSNPGGGAAQENNEDATMVFGRVASRGAGLPDQTPPPTETDATQAFKVPGKGARPSPVVPESALAVDPAAKTIAPRRRPIETPLDENAPLDPARMRVFGMPAAKGFSRPTPSPAAPAAARPVEPAAGTSATLVPGERLAAPAPERRSGEATQKVRRDSPAKPRPSVSLPPWLVGLGAALLLGALAAFAWSRLGARQVPQSALDALAAARATAAVDSKAALAEAEGRAQRALALAGPRARFPEGIAGLAAVEAQWADAVQDEAAILTARGSRSGDAAAQAAAQARASELQDEARARLRIAFDAAGPASRREPQSVDLALALADSYRVQGSTALYGRELRRAQAERPDDPRIPALQALAAASADESPERALPALKAAVAARPEEVRLRVKLAELLLATRDSAGAADELRRALQLSPQHERARLLLDGLAPAPGAAQTSPPPPGTTSR